MSVRPESQLSQIAEMIGYFTMVLSCSIIGSYAWVTLRKRSQKATPTVGGTMRLRTVSGIYRARFLRETPEGWVFSAPIKRDVYVPLREGEAVTAECPTEHGVLLFRTHVISRENETHELILEKPKQANAHERRSQKRLRLNGISLTVEAIEGNLLDISEGGAKAVLPRRFANGDRVAVQLPWAESPTYAAVLETQVEDGRGMYSTRLVFEEPVKVQWSRLRFAVEA
ncbi:MAG: flagellar brake protein [Fimbriimonadaceae bacterium]|nr:flagellar brake protein [Fimbriimonadaceae bacterium]